MYELVLQRGKPPCHLFREELNASVNSAWQCLLFHPVPGILEGSANSLSSQAYHVKWMLSKKPNKEAEAITSAALIKCSTRHFDRNEFSSAYGKIFMEKNAVAFS